MLKWLFAALPILAFCDDHVSMGSVAEVPVPEYAGEGGDTIDVIEDFEIDFDYDEEDDS